MSALTPKCWLLISALASRLSSGGGAKGLLKYLSDEDAKVGGEFLKQTGVQSFRLQSPVDLLPHPEREIGHIHYSWFYPVIAEYPASIRPFLIASLPESAQKGLLSLFQKDKNAALTPPLLAPILKTYFFRILYNAIHDPSLPPLEILPPSKMEQLLNTPKEKLVDLITLLGIHDIAPALRQVIDKKVWEYIQSCLSDEQKAYLKICLQMQDVPLSPKILIGQWKGTSDSMAHLLHHRGLIRLGKAISQESLSFIWALTHRLDTGRGQQLKQFTERVNAEEPIDPIRVQVLQLHERLMSGKTNEAI